MKDLYIVPYQRARCPRFSVTGDEKARKALWDDLLDRAIEELGLMNGLETELEQGGISKVQENLEDLDREFLHSTFYLEVSYLVTLFWSFTGMNKKVEHMFNDCNKLMESIEVNLSTLQSRWVSLDLFPYESIE